MNVFQLVVSSLLLLLILVTATAAVRRKMAWGPALFWLSLWIAATVAILFPGLTVIVARFLGIDRGADLVFYFGILAMFAGFFLTYVKLRQTEKHLTVLVRRMAIYEASLPTAPDVGDAAPATEDHGDQD